MISASNFLIIVMVYYEIPNWFTDFLQGIHVGWIIFSSENTHVHVHVENLNNCSLNLC